MTEVSRLFRTLIVGKGQEFVFRKPKSPLQTIEHCGPVGLYLHIPFCKSLCPYCPYFKVPYNKELAGEYVKAVLKEIDQYRFRLGPMEVTSIYVGGGTPTLLVDELKTVLEQIHKQFHVTGEVCLETSPNALSPLSLEKLKDYGVDLLSIGVQSFDEQYLKFLGRGYDKNAVAEAVERAVSWGFKSVNLDLIFAYPGQTSGQLKADLSHAMACNTNQITAYPLFTFPYTSVGRHLGLKKTQMPGLRKRRELYQTLHRYCEASGFERTSVWGFKRSGTPRYSSVTRDRFIGLGAGAGSHVSGLFYFNTFSVEEYIRALFSDKAPMAFEMELSPSLEALYWLYWRLYDTQIGQDTLLKQMGQKHRQSTRLAVGSLRKLGMCKLEGKKLSLTERGAFWIHLLQNQYVLNYIDKVWSVASHEPWPSEIEI